MFLRLLLAPDDLAPAGEAHQLLGQDLVRERCQLLQPEQRRDLLEAELLPAGTRS